MKKVYKIVHVKGNTKLFYVIPVENIMLQNMMLQSHCHREGTENQ